MNPTELIANAKDIGEAIKVATRVLADAGVASPEHDARAMAAHLLGVRPLSIDRKAAVPELYASCVSRRARREPLQHILGVAPFGHLDLTVGPGVFIPRPETELLADWALRQSRLYEQATVVDLCTGSGAIAQYIASSNRGARVVGVEKQAYALDFARTNAPDATIVQGDVHEMILPELHGRVDVVATNPPYVPEDPHLDPEVYHDPHEAVFSGDDGLGTIRAMMPLIVALLRPGGVVGIEHDESHAPQVREVAARAGLQGLETRMDFNNRPRFMLGSKVKISGEIPTYERFLT